MVPAKLVKKINRGEFVDMAELLKDIIEVERKQPASEGEFSEGHIGQAIFRREIPDFMSWPQCFSLYTAVVSSKFPDKARELWAYQATIINEFQWCAGGGWRLYDTAFRQHISSLESTDSSKSNQGLYSTKFLVYGGGGEQFCQSYM